jgi:hypothetical protein
MKKFIFFLLIFLSASLFLFAQTDTTGTGGGGFSLPANITMILGIALALYEVIIRFFPTVKNYSILGWVIKLIQTILPNRSAVGPNHP